MDCNPNKKTDFELIKEEYLSNDNNQLMPTEAELWLNQGVVKEEYSNKQTYEQELSWNGTTDCAVEVDPLDLRQPDSIVTSGETNTGDSSPKLLKSDMQDGTHEKYELYIKTEKLTPEISQESYIFIVTNLETKDNDEEGSHLAGYSNSPKDNNKLNLNTVKWELNQRSNFSCIECQYREIASGFVKKHLTFHNTGIQVACNSCGVKFDPKKKLDKSVKCSDTTYSCDICQYTCKNKRNLRTHVSKHEVGIKKPYGCSFCPKKYSDSNSLKVHLSKHTGVKPYACTFCERRYGRKSHLKSHLSTHTGEKPFSCTYCEFRCSVGYLLKRHLKKHTNGKPNSCTYCEYSCWTKTDLKIHLRTHTGEKPFSCTYCEYKCSRSHQLRRHVRTHTGEKAYSCPYCLYGCSRKPLLNQHLLKHTEVSSQTYPRILCKAVT